MQTEPRRSVIIGLCVVERFFLPDLPFQPCTSPQVKNKVAVDSLSGGESCNRLDSAVTFMLLFTSVAAQSVIINGPI